MGEGGILQMWVKIKTPKIPYGYHQNPRKILGSKINPPKNPMSNFLALKFPESNTSLVVFICRTTWLGYARTTMNLQIVLNAQKILTKSSQPKKHLPNFPTQKNPGIKNFKPPNPRHWKSWVPPLVLSLRNEQWGNDIIYSQARFLLELLSCP